MKFFHTRNCISSLCEKCCISTSREYGNMMLHALAQQYPDMGRFSYMLLRDVSLHPEHKLNSLYSTSTPFSLDIAGQLFLFHYCKWKQYAFLICTFPLPAPAPPDVVPQVGKYSFSGLNINWISGEKPALIPPSDYSEQNAIVWCAGSLPCSRPTNCYFMSEHKPWLGTFR